MSDLTPGEGRAHAWFTPRLSPRRAAPVWCAGASTRANATPQGGSMPRAVPAPRAEPGSGAEADPEAEQRAEFPPRVRLGVPAYGHPLLAKAEWAELARPGTPLAWVVVNVAEGAGVRPDPAVRQATAAVRAAGAHVLGYLDTGFGHRPVDELMSDAGRYAGWYQVRGFFLDQVATSAGALGYYRAAAGALRGLGNGPVVLNPGAHPCPEYAELADQVVTFDGSWSDYRQTQVPDWVDAYPAQRFCHLVHGVPVQHVETVLRLARWQGAGTVYVTDRGAEDPWIGLPSYWRREVAMAYR